MMACEVTLNHLGIDHAPTRSTNSDGNKNPDRGVIETTYHRLYKSPNSLLSDSRNTAPLLKGQKLGDSTAIELFKEILKKSGA